MNIPAVPLPEPVLVIKVTCGNAKQRRSMITALRYLLWAVPACAVDYALATAGGGRHSLWLTLAAAFITLAIAVLLIGPQDGREGEP